MSNLEFLPPLLARITLGVAFVVSGKNKLKDVPGTASFFKGLKIPGPTEMVYFVSATELVCGVLLFAGALTRYAAFPLLCTMVVVLITARRKEIGSFLDLTGIYEFSYLILLGYLMVYGGGSCSVDFLMSH